MGFVKKEEVLGKVGGKILVFGAQASGKTTFAGTFPRSAYCDSEDGATYYLKNNPNILAVMRTTSASEVQETLDDCIDDGSVNDFDTFVIDSATKLYENMQASAMEVVTRRARKKKMKGKDVDMDDLNLSQRDWGSIKRTNQQLATTFITLSSMGKWLVSVAHQKDLYAPQTKEEVEKQVPKVKIGEIPDMARGAEYDYDIVAQTFTETDKDGVPHYFMRILKDRTGATKLGQVIENPTFDGIWRKVWEGTENLETKKIDMSADTKKDEKLFEDDKDDISPSSLADEIKSLLTSLPAEAKKQGLGKITELGINAKDLAGNDISKLVALRDFLKNL